MELYELDGWWIFRRVGLHDDDFVTTLEFPTLTGALSGVSCDIYECTGGRTGSWKNSTGSDTVSAQAAVRITGAQFTDPSESCCNPLTDPGCQN